MAQHDDHSHNEPAREREVIVTDGGGGRGGGGAGAVIAAIIGVLVVLFLAWLLFGGFGGGGDGDTGDTTNIEAPELEVPDEAEVDVNVDDGGEG